jgi:hypothetical protein
MVIEAYAKPGQLVLDPMCGIGTALVEAVHAGRDAVGVEYEPRWSSLARDNLDRSVDHGATGHGADRTGDARDTARTTGRRRGRAGAAAADLAIDNRGHTQATFRLPAGATLKSGSRFAK